MKQEPIEQFIRKGTKKSPELKLTNVNLKSRINFSGVSNKPIKLINNVIQRSQNFTSSIDKTKCGNIKITTLNKSIIKERNKIPYYKDLKSINKGVKTLIKVQNQNQMKKQISKAQRIQMMMNKKNQAGWLIFKNQQKKHTTLESILNYLKESLKLKTKNRQIQFNPFFKKYHNISSEQKSMKSHNLLINSQKISSSRNSKKYVKGPFIFNGENRIVSINSKDHLFFYNKFD